MTVETNMASNAGHCCVVCGKTDVRKPVAHIHFFSISYTSFHNALSVKHVYSMCMGRCDPKEKMLLSVVDFGYEP